MKHIMVCLDLAFLGVYILFLAHFLALKPLRQAERKSSSFSVRNVEVFGSLMPLMQAHMYSIHSPTWHRNSFHKEHWYFSEY